MAKLEFQLFCTPKRKRCVCCDLVGPVEARLILWDKDRILGDLELCNGCAEGWKTALRLLTVHEEWNFKKGG